MKEYHIRVLNLSGPYETPYHEYSVTANRIVYSSNTIDFFIGQEFVSAFPIRFTIIVNVENKL